MGEALFNIYASACINAHKNYKIVKLQMYIKREYQSNTLYRETNDNNE